MIMISRVAGFLRVWSQAVHADGLVGKRIAVLAILIATSSCISHDCRAETISIWIRAFIPNTGTGSIVRVPGREAQTMLDGKLLGCFLTDQRSFSSGFDQQGRLASSITFTISTAGISNVRQSHQTGVTQAVDCVSGSTVGRCKARAENKGMVFKNIQFDPVQKIGSFALEGAASNPCFEWMGPNPAPNIHYKVLFSINTANKTWGLTAITGQFPSFEAYMQVGGQPVKTLFRLDALDFNLGSSIFFDRVPHLERTGSY